MRQKLLAILIALALSAGQASAERLSPTNVPPVTVGGVRYSVPHFGVFIGKAQNGGYVEATDEKTGTRLWLAHVYEIKYDPDLEGDVQDVFITTLRVADGKLTIENEAGDKFAIDLRTGKILEGAGRVYRVKRKGR